MKKNAQNVFFTTTLIHWNSSFNKRLMPWKGEKDPYKIWLSEIILQQTRVGQGWEYYNSFIKKYPTVKKLAAAKDSEVFKLWEGLGYYSRCKNLIASAKFIAHDLHGKFPDTYTTILKLKGVGSYTAAAIASFAYNQPYAVVDGNVSRLLARFFAIETAIDSAGGKSFFAGLAQALLYKTNPALYNQAIMDFGATVCKPRLPLCSICVLQKKCKAFAAGIVNVLPVKEKKIIKKERWFYYIIAEFQKNFFVRKRTGRDIWQNLHEFILIEEKKKLTHQQIFETDIFRQIISKTYTVKHVSGFYTQQLTHQTIHGCFIHIKITKKPAIAGYMLLPSSRLSQLAFPKLINNYLQQS